MHIYVSPLGWSPKYIWQKIQSMLKNTVAGLTSHLVDVCTLYSTKCIEYCIEKIYVVLYISVLHIFRWKWRKHYINNILTSCPCLKSAWKTTIADCSNASLICNVWNLIGTLISLYFKLFLWGIKTCPESLITLAIKGIAIKGILKVRQHYKAIEIDLRMFIKISIYRYIKVKNNCNIKIKNTKQHIWKT